MARTLGSTSIAAPNADPLKWNNTYMLLILGMGQRCVQTMPCSVASHANFANMNIPCSIVSQGPIVQIWLGVHDMQQASHKAESGDHKHAVNDT